MDSADRHAFEVTRVVEASPALVWRAFTDEAWLTAWWGPHGFTATAQLDVRQGGHFTITMQAADGQAYPVDGVFLSVQSPTASSAGRLVMDMSLDNHPANWRDYLAELFTKAGGAAEDLATVRVMTRVTLEALAVDRTRVIVVQTYESEALRDAFAGMGNAEGWSQSLDRLEKRVMSL